VGELICAYCDDLINADVNTILTGMQAKHENTLKMSWRNIYKVRQFANQLDPLQQFRSDVHFLDLLIAIERASQQLGHEIRLDSLAYLGESLTRRQASTAVCSNTKPK
jgi:hypothetical protein